MYREENCRANYISSTANLRASSHFQKRKIRNLRSRLFGNVVRARDRLIYGRIIFSMRPYYTLVQQNTVHVFMDSHEKFTSVIKCFHKIRSRVHARY